MCFGHVQVYERHTFSPRTTMRSALFLYLLIFSGAAMAQPTLGNARDTGAQAVDSPDTAMPGDVRVTLSPEIDKLLSGYTEHKHSQRGYRVQIFLGDRATAESTKRGFLQKNPDVPAYLSWLAPNFRLRVGDLRTRLEAERLLRDLKTTYPGSYIVPDDIEMPLIPPGR